MTRPAAVAAGRLSRGARAGLIRGAGCRVECPRPVKAGSSSPVAVWLVKFYPSPVSWFEAASVTRPAAVAAGRLSRGARAGLIPKAGFRVGCPRPMC